MRTFLLYLIFVLLCQKTLPQSSVEIVNRISSGKIFTSEQELKEWIVLCGNDTAKLFSTLNTCKLDSIPADKLYNSIYLLKGISVKHTSRSVKNAAVNLFISTSKSKQSGVSSLSLKVLNNFPSSSFDNANVDSISSLILKYPTLYKDAVLLAGYIGDTLFVERIKNVFPNSRNFSKPERWATYKALARLGDKEALNYCINRVSSLPLNDQVVDVLYPDLVYIHKREALEVMVKALYSDDNLCTSTNPNSDIKIVCGYRIMELLASVVADYPVKILPSGDLDVKDYKQALKDVRSWFEKNRSTYRLK